MVLGCSSLPKGPADFEQVTDRGRRVGSVSELEMGLATKRLEYHSPVHFWYEAPEAVDGTRAAGTWIYTTAGRAMLNSILPDGLKLALGYQNTVMRKKALSQLVFESYRRGGRAPPREVPEAREGVAGRQP